MYNSLEVLRMTYTNKVLCSNSVSYYFGISKHYLKVLWFHCNITKAFRIKISFKTSLK